MPSEIGEVIKWVFQWKNLKKLVNFFQMKNRRKYKFLLLFFFSFFTPGRPPRNRVSTNFLLSCCKIIGSKKEIQRNSYNISSLNYSNIIYKVSSYHPITPYCFSNQNL